MVRQSTFMIVAELGPDAEESLRALLAMLNREQPAVQHTNRVERTVLQGHEKASR